MIDVMYRLRALVRSLATLGGSHGKFSRVPQVHWGCVNPSAAAAIDSVMANPIA